MNPILLSILVIFVYMSSWWVLSLVTKRADIADVAWGGGFTLLAWILYISYFGGASLALAMLVSLWGLRLSTHIYLRNSRRKNEDSRYANWRKKWGTNWRIKSYLEVFLLQGFFMLLIATPIILSSGQVFVSSALAIVGTLVFLFGLMFEAVSDWQVLVFKSSGGKGVFDRGLWKYSRHPNYFGEVTLWWGISLLAFSQTTNLAVFLGSTTISILILFVSGIPLLEKRYKDDAAYKKYAKKTSIFFPLPPKGK